MSVATEETMELTGRARQRLDDYLSRVEHALRGRPELDARDVVAGLREHVESELAALGGDFATAEEMADVLDRLGAHDQIVAGDAAVPVFTEARLG